MRRRLNRFSVVCFPGAAEHPWGGPVHLLVPQHPDTLPQQPLLRQEHSRRLQVPDGGGQGLPRLASQVGQVFS